MSKSSNGSRPESTKERRARAVDSLQNGEQVPAAARPSLPMSPPVSLGVTDGGASLDEPRVPLEQELMTLKVRLPALGANGELEAPKTMRVKVPRQAGVDASVVGAAVAQSLQQLNISQNAAAPVQRAGSPSDSLPHDDRGSRGGGGDRRRHSGSEGDGYYEEEFVADEAPSIGRELSLRDIFFMVRERWMLGLSVGLLAAGALAFWMMSKPAVYQSEAELLVELNEDKVLPQMESIDQEGTSTLEQAMQVHVRKLQSAAYRQFVLETLEATTLAATPTQPDPKLILQAPYRTYQAFTKAYNQGLTNMLLRGREPKPGEVLPSQEEMFQNHYYGARNGKDQLSVSTSKKSQFITVAFKHPDKTVARQVTHAMVECYNSFLGEKEKLIHKSAGKFLEKQTSDLEQQIRLEEANIIRFKQVNGIVENLEDGDSREGYKFNALDSQAARAGFDLVELELQLKQVEANGFKDPMRLSQMPVISEYGAVAEIKAKIDENRAERNLLDIKYLALHPKITANNTARVALLDDLATSVSLSVQDLRDRVEQKRQEEAKLKGAIAAAEDQALENDDPMVEYKVRQSGLDILKGDYKMLREQLGEIRISEALERTRVDVMTPALMPEDPVDPDKKKVLALSSLLLLGGLFGLPIGLGFLDTRLKSFSEAEAFLGIECLGCVPERPKLSHMELGQCVLSEQDEQIVESFRVVYGSVDLHSKVPAPKVIVTTSTGPGEGKSFCTANLAGTFARHGSRVLVIDGDLRKPSQHKLVGSRNDAGVLKWFRAGGIPPATAKELVEDTDLGLVPLSDEHDIFLLRAGGSTRNPSEIITSKPFEALIHNLRHWFDIIMIDTPPVGLFPDALFLANYAEEAIFVCKHNSLNRHKIKFALRKLEGGNANVLGTIMNQLSASKRHQYGYGYKDYGYGSYSYNDYAKYYTAEDEEEEDARTK